MSTLISNIFSVVKSYVTPEVKSDPKKERIEKQLNKVLPPLRGLQLSLLDRSLKQWKTIEHDLSVCQEAFKESAKVSYTFGQILQRMPQKSDELEQDLSTIKEQFGRSNQLAKEEGIVLVNRAAKAIENRENAITATKANCEKIIQEIQG